MALLGGEQLEQNLSPRRRAALEGCCLGDPVEAEGGVGRPGPVEEGRQPVRDVEEVVELLATGRPQRDRL